MHNQIALNALLAEVLFVDGWSRTCLLTWISLNQVTWLFWYDGNNLLSASQSRDFAVRWTLSLESSVPDWDFFGSLSFLKDLYRWISIFFWNLRPHFLLLKLRLHLRIRHTFACCVKLGEFGALHDLEFFWFPDYSLILSSLRTCLVFRRVLDFDRGNLILIWATSAGFVRFAFNSRAKRVMVNERLLSRQWHRLFAS